MQSRYGHSVAAVLAENLPVSLMSLLPEIVEACSEAGITRVAHIGGLDQLNLPVTCVVRPNASSISVASGKGSTTAAAVASGIMEALELFYAEEFNQFIRFRDVPSKIIIPEPHSLPHVHGMAGANALVDDETPMVVGHDIASDHECAVPLDLVHARLSPDWHRCGSGFLVSTNGLGGSTTWSGAILHAICEVVERDAVALLYASDPDRQLRLNALDLSSIEDDECRELIERITHCGLRIAVFDITSDIGLPTFYCRLTGHNASIMRNSVAADGAGCHPLANVALRRAITEAVQTRVLLASGARDDIRSWFYVGSNWQSDSQSFIPLRESITHAGSSDEDLVELASAQVRRAGMSNIVVIALSGPHAPLKFVRVIVPGLEGSIHSSRYAPGMRAQAVAGSA